MADAEGKNLLRGGRAGQAGGALGGIASMLGEEGFKVRVEQ
jgi:hypothetical protein